MVTITICICISGIVFFALSLNPTSGQKQKAIIYVLQWYWNAFDSWQTYWHLQRGREAFVSRNCAFQNCYLTVNRSFFNNILDFDVLVFNVEYLTSQESFLPFPPVRSDKQLYVFLSSEPAALYPIADAFDNFFNVTWTYKLDSDIVHPFFIVKDNKGEVVAPKKNAHWIKLNDLPPITNNIKLRLRNKSIAAAWVASAAHCGDGYSRHVFVRNLIGELFKYGHRVDIYGGCGILTCEKKENEERAHILHNCYEKIEKDYYFYLAFENSFAEDYVSEKVLHGLQHFSVPIVFGGADYTRFLPTGSYIDAYKLGEIKLAELMNDLINHPLSYMEFFKWHGYYSFQDSTDKNHRESACSFCALLNSWRDANAHQMYHNLTDWWNTNSSEPYSLKDAATSTSNQLDEKQNFVSKIISKMRSWVDYFFDE